MNEKRKLLGNFEKIFDEISIEKLHFYFILENLLLKIEPSEITPFFYNNFSVSGGFPLSPWLRPLPMPMDSEIFKSLNRVVGKVGGASWRVQAYWEQK